MPYRPVSVRESPVNEHIVAALKDSSICRQIALFLLKNENAVDTVRGIATWWLGCEEIAAQAALDQLTACGVVNVRTLISGSVYELTPDPKIRSSLRVALMRELMKREKAPRRTKKVLAGLAAGKHENSLAEPAYNFDPH